MNKQTLTLTQIENGWLIACPPDSGEMKAAQVAQRQPQGTIIYCADHEEVCTSLKRYFPVS